MTVRLPVEQISWTSVQNVFVFGSIFEFLNDGLKKGELTSGLYVNRDGDWLILIHPEESEIEAYLNRCGNALRSLRINYTALTELDVSALTALEELHVKRNPKLPCIHGLTPLTSLTALNLSLCDSLTQLPPLESLTQLTSLDLSRCSSLTQLPPLDSLSQLTELNLSDCYSLTQLPPLDSLSKLTRLNLSNCASLTHLPPLDSLSQLTELYLSFCRRLTQLPMLNSLSQLTTLDLSDCRNLRELPAGIHYLKSLRILNLRRLDFRELPDWLPEIAEGFSLEEHGWKSGENKANVYLYGTAVEDIPDMSIFEQPYEMVVKWFEERKRGKTRTLNEIKVVFLGDGEAGKSHTIARLMNDGGDPVDYMDQSTPGIVIKRRDYTVDGRQFRVNYWDFGGQEIMHSMHRIFLTGRTMYVVLLNARDDTQGDRARYWLHNIKSFAPEAPVLLVLNKIDQNENASVDEVDLRSRYQKLTRVVRLSARDFSQEKFNREFTDVLLEEIQNTGYLDAQWPIAWTKVKEKLENMTSHYILGDDYQTICEACQVDDNQKNLLHWFNDLGVSFCFCDDREDYALKDYVILRPDWITNALYIILFNALAGARNGLIPHSAIYDTLLSAHKNPSIRCTLPGTRYLTGDIGYVLGIMRKFNLSFTDGHNNEFIPMLCQQNSTVDVQYYHRDAETLEFNMEFDYLPNNLLHRLMVERHAELDITRVWRTGASFRLDELGYNAVVVIDGNTLRFFIRHANPMHRPNTYLTMLKASVDRIVAKMGLKAPSCQLIYKLDGKRDEFDFEMLKAMQESGLPQAFSMTWRRTIPIVDILNQSSPDRLEDEKKLLDAIRRSCQNLQGELDYRLNGNGHGMEDKRNRRIRDDLFGWGYNIQDQTQRGRSGSGSSIGELDLLLHDDNRELWTAIEALRVSNGRKAEWNQHLTKLISNYNFFGARCLYLLTYVDADPEAFADIWKGYQTHIKTFDPGQYTYSEGSFVDLNDDNSPKYVKTAKCRYSCGGELTTVYHIFARIPTQNE